LKVFPFLHYGHSVGLLPTALPSRVSIGRGSGPKVIYTKLNPLYQLPDPLSLWQKLPVRVLQKARAYCCRWQGIKIRYIHVHKEKFNVRAMIKRQQQKERRGNNYWVKE
jgi:hypothetical protein